MTAGQMSGGFAPDESLRADLNQLTLANKPLTPNEVDAMRGHQFALAISAAPMHVIFVGCTLLATGLLALPHTSGTAIRLWQGLAAIPALAIIALIIAHHLGRGPKSPTRGIQFLEAAALGEALVFIIPVAFFVPDMPDLQKFALFGLTLLLAAIAAISLARIPVAGTIVAAMLVGATSAAMYFSLPALGFAPSMAAITFGIMLIGIVVNMHWEFISRSYAEIELGRQQQLVAMLLNDYERATSDWLWETDVEGRLTYFSPRLAAIAGKAEADIRGKRFVEFVPQAASIEAWQALANAMTRQVDLPGLMVPYETPEKMLYWHMSARALKSKDGSFLGYRGVGRDMTDKWSADLDARQARESAERANIAKSQFLSVISHEIRTPINAILGFSELLAADTEMKLNPDVRQEYFTTVVNSAKQLQTLVGSILDATRLEKGAIKILEQDVDAAELIEVVVGTFKDQLVKQDLTLMVKLTDGISLLGDIQRINQIVSKLLDNAIKFSPMGGIVHLDIQKGRAGEFILSLRDAGIGLNEYELEKVFEPFAQGDEGHGRRYGGLGLGLPIARNLAQLHGGDITLISTPGTGTEARFVMPPSRVRWPEADQKAASAA